MENFLGWMRFVVFDGEQGELYVSVENAKQVAKAEGKDDQGFVGKYVKPIDLQNEVLAWKKIH